MLLSEQLISNDEIKIFQKYFDSNEKKAHINYDQQSDTTLDARLLISSGSNEYEIIKRIIYGIAPDTTIMYCALQKQYFPHGLHIDVFDIPNPNTYTLVLALESVPQFKTIVFKDKFPDKVEYKKYLGELSIKIQDMEIKNNLRQDQDLEHTILINNKYFLCDYLTLDGIFEYSAGKGVVFNSRKLHCSSNWLKYPHLTQRNLLQIHFSTAKHYDF